MNFITASTIAMLSVSGMHAISSRFAYNTEIVDNIVMSQTVYKKSNGLYLTNHLRYNFTYDAQDRIEEKEVVRWNPYANQWENDYCLAYSYDIDQYTIEYIRWDKQMQTYSNMVEKKVYSKTGVSLINIASYTWNNHTGNWVLTDNLIASSAPDSRLYAYEKELNEEKTE